MGRDRRGQPRFVNAVFWIMRTGAPWRDLPPDYGDWKNTHRRFCRWQDKGVWERLLEAVVDDLDFEWLMVDSACAKADGGRPFATPPNPGGLRLFWLLR